MKSAMNNLRRIGPLLVFKSTLYRTDMSAIDIETSKNIGLFKQNSTAMSKYAIKNKWILNTRV